MTESPEQSDATGMLVPTGRSIFRHGSTWLVAKRECKDATEGQARDKLRLLLVKAAFRQLIDEARQVFAAKHEGHTAIYFVDEYGGWARVGCNPSRPAASSIVNWARPRRFSPISAASCHPTAGTVRRTGHTYRRGYLLHGPPGTGATLIPSPQNTPSALFIEQEEVGDENFIFGMTVDRVIRRLSLPVRDGSSADCLTAEGRECSLHCSTSVEWMAVH